MHHIIPFDTFPFFVNTAEGTMYENEFSKYALFFFILISCAGRKKEPHKEEIDDSQQYSRQGSL